MIEQQFSSKRLKDAIDEISNLPSIGRKTALRLVLNLIKKNEQQIESLSCAIKELTNISYCKNCHNISDEEICQICNDNSRDKNTICVVEDIRDVIAIENTQYFRGNYHILGGKISPMDGISVNQLNIPTLITKIQKYPIKEVILALSSTTEGDTTNFYIYKNLKEYNVKISTIARGISIGDEIEYTDEVTLGNSISNRVPYNTTVTNF